MDSQGTHKRLKKELSLFKVYALATGATLSSGFFLLPGLAATSAGPAVILSYLIASVHLIPAVFCMAELSTAMPRSGGIYYFLDRSMGPLMGTIGGFGTWLALILKTSFALIGMSAYVDLFFPEVPVKPLAVGLAALFGGVNLLGAKKTGGFQIVLVVALLITLACFLATGSIKLNTSHFTNFLASGFDSIYSTAGLVYISYVGITNIASVSEEVKNPEKNLPKGMFLGLATAIIIYGLGTAVMVGVMPQKVLQNNLTPVASAAEHMFGHTGAVVMTIAAVLAFFSVSNAAILSASRYPLAMSRDHLLPRSFRLLSKRRTPKVAIYATVAIIVFCITVLEPAKIAKLASAFQLLLFALCCLSVIIMRESSLEAYDPGYRAPFYPWLQIIGILLPILLIAEMGWLTGLFTIGLVSISSLWYVYYGKDRIQRGGAIYHYFARLGQRRYEGLDRELREILKEKGLRAEDPFDLVIAKASLFDVPAETSFEALVDKASAEFSRRLGSPADTFKEAFMQGTRIGATPVSRGAALPHMRLPDLERPEVVIIRAKAGVVVNIEEEFQNENASTEPVYAFFFLVSPEGSPGQHLRLLAQIAGQVDTEAFMLNWRQALNEQELKELLLRNDYFLSLHLEAGSPAGALANKAVRDIRMPEGSLIALIHRDGEIIVPRGRTILREGDRLTIIGEPEGILDLNQTYTEHTN